MSPITLIPLLALSMILTVPAQARDDPMEAQRCIWRCMEGTPGWDGRNAKAYERCTRETCSGRPKATKRRRS